MELIIFITSLVFIALVAQLIARKNGSVVLGFFAFTVLVFAVGFLTLFVG